MTFNQKETKMWPNFFEFLITKMASTSERFSHQLHSHGWRKPFLQFLVFRYSLNSSNWYGKENCKQWGCNENAKSIKWHHSVGYSHIPPRNIPWFWGHFSDPKKWMWMLLQLSCCCSTWTGLKCNKSNWQLLINKTHQDNLFSDLLIKVYKHF